MLCHWYAHCVSRYTIGMPFLNHTTTILTLIPSIMKRTLSCFLHFAWLGYILALAALPLRANGQATTVPDFSLVGYATLTTGTTGGAGGRSITVTTGTELQNALKAKIKESTPLTIYVAGKITPENSPGLSKIDIKDLRDVSILGVGTLGEFDGIGLKVYRAGNVIIRNLKVHHVRIGDKDCISIEGPADHIWVDHCELYNEYQGVHKDYYDALLDAKAQSEYITLSWNYLHDSWKASLAGSSESDTYDRKITYHHNYFRNLNSRLPLYRGGNGHVFNNYYKDVESTAINSRLGACLKIENNYFENVINPYVTAYSSVDGYGDVEGNILVNSPFKYASDTRELPVCVASVPYRYASVLHQAADVPSVVAQYAGVGVIDVTDGGGSPQPQPATFQLSTSVTGQGTVSPASGTFTEGSTATLTATPASGWQFSGWSGDATGNSNPLAVTMNSHKTIAATFVQSTPGGGGSEPGPAPGGSVLTIPVTATAANGLCSADGVIRVTSDGTPVMNLSNSAGKGITWKVEVPEAGAYALSWRYAGGGSAALEYGKLLVNNAVVQADVPFPKPKDSNSFLTTKPLTVQLGRGVNEIRIEAPGTFADIEWIKVEGVSPLAADCSKEIGSGGGSPQPFTYTLTASSNTAEGGTITFSPAGGIYAAGTEVTITATPQTGFAFAGWGGAAGGTDLSITLTMDGSKEISAGFTEILHALRYKTIGYGSISEEEGNYREGTELILEALPETGWQFVEWRGDVSGTTNPLRLSIDAPKNIEAVFSEIEYQVNATVKGQGSLSFANSRYTVERSVTFTATPAEGWVFVCWLGDAEGNTNPLQLTMDSDKMVTALFERKTYHLAVNVLGQGNVSPAAGTYTEGETVLLVASPAEGWVFEGWSGDATGAASLHAITMDSHKALTAVFGLSGKDKTKEDKKTSLATVYPNPFSGSATFQFEVKERTNVNITLYDLNGVKVAGILDGNQVFEKGTHSVLYTNTALKKGVYFYIVQVGNEVMREQLLVE